MMLPEYLNDCVIHQDLVGQVDNQERCQEYAYLLVRCAALLIRG